MHIHKIKYPSIFNEVDAGPSTLKFNYLSKPTFLNVLKTLLLHTCLEYMTRSPKVPGLSV